MTPNPEHEKHRDAHTAGACMLGVKTIGEQTESSETYDRAVGENASSDPSARPAGVRALATSPRVAGSSSSALLVYVPVIHEGFHQVFNKHPDSVILLVGRTITARYRPLVKDIRCLEPGDVAQYLRVVLGREAQVVESDDLATVLSRFAHVVAVDDEAVRDVVTRLKTNTAPSDSESSTTPRDTETNVPVLPEIHWDSAFLRWDATRSLAGKPVDYDGAVTAEQYARDMQQLGRSVMAHSSDWWRQVAAVATRDGQVLDVAYNAHKPTEHEPYFSGDPRGNFSRGDHIEVSTALHAEAAIVARAAAAGVSLRGAQIHVTTFPCPGCARLIAAAGFSRCYFSGPYSMLAGGQVLRAAGVELVFVEAESESGPGNDEASGGEGQSGPANVSV